MRWKKTADIQKKKVVSYFFFATPSRTCQSSLCWFDQNMSRVQGFHCSITKIKEQKTIANNKTREKLHHKEKGKFLDVASWEWMLLRRLIVSSYIETWLRMLDLTSANLGCCNKQLNVVGAPAAERKTRVSWKSSQTEVKQAPGETDCHFFLGGPTLKKQTVVGCQWR